eukprot:symbB.v1.2.011572.t2/scaffold781.1/size163279/6
MTDRLAVKGSKTVKKLALNEMLEALEEPQKDEASQLMRVKVKTEREGKEGYVTLETVNGMTFIKTSLPHQVMMTRVECAVEEMSEVSGEPNEGWFPGMRE